MFYSVASESCAGGMKSITVSLHRWRPGKLYPAYANWKFAICPLPSSFSLILPENKGTSEYRTLGRGPKFFILLLYCWLIWRQSLIFIFFTIYYTLRLFVLFVAVLWNEELVNTFWSRLFIVILLYIFLIQCPCDDNVFSYTIVVCL